MIPNYSTDQGYGIRIVAQQAEDFRPAGHVVEIHFYDPGKAVEFAAGLISFLSEEQRLQAERDILIAWEKARGRGHLRIREDQ